MNKTFIVVLVLKMFRRLNKLFYFITVIHISVCLKVIRQEVVNIGIGISNSEPCSCVEFYLCGPDNYIITSGESIIDIRLGKTNTECTETEVCCRLRRDTTTVPSTSTTTVSSASTVSTMSTIAPVNPVIPCGIRHFGGLSNIAESRILPNEGQVGFGEFPWMAIVLMTDTDRSMFLCGASVIQENIVLTAGHCVSQMRATDIKIHTGRWNLSSKVESLPYQERFVSRIIIHPDFDPRSLKNDIALLVLSKPLLFTSNVAAICLPKDKTFVNSTDCIATGWGKNAFGQKGKYQTILKMTVLPLVPHEECQARLRTTRLSKYFKLDQSFVCAGGETNTDTCEGDGGGPLVCSIYGTNPPIYVQMGITSWGIECGGPIPGVYAYVFAELPWLTAELANISASSFIKPL